MAKARKAKAVARGRKPARSRRIAEQMLADLKARLREVSDLRGASAVLDWDQATYMPQGGAEARGRQTALLSRLAHVHEVPIKDSSTEGDCLSLAARKLDAARVEYATQLVRTWQRAIYGGLAVETATVHALCAGFARHLDAPVHGAAGDVPLASGAAA